ncbi:MAG: Rossmann-like and DUF2520 domain-containing protein [Wenzhouxiangellaceae bacterium]
MARVKLNVIGCGRVGRVLVRAWHVAGVVEPGWIMNRSLESAEQAVAFIGAGRAVGRPEAADDELLMVAVPDGTFEALADALGLSAPLADRAFHVSGAVSAEVLRPLARRVASVHPVCPFADPETAQQRLAGCWAVAEGDEALVDELLPLFDRLGMRTLVASLADKRLYHAGTIAASNFLTVTAALACDLLVHSGLEAARAREIVVSLMRSALDNVQALGPVQALTGPVERGDVAAVNRIVEALGALDGGQRRLFVALVGGAAELAERKLGPDRRPAVKMIELMERVSESAGGARGGL